MFEEEPVYGLNGECHCFKFETGELILLACQHFNKDICIASSIMEGYGQQIADHAL